MMTTFPARHLSVTIERPPSEVYAFAVRPENLPRWAAGLSGSIEQVGGRWIADSPMGKIEVRFAPPNHLWVLDHDVTLLESGATIHNPMRVVPNGEGSELFFTLLRRPEMTDEELAADARAVERDLATVKRLLEATQPASAPGPSGPGAQRQAAAGCVFCRIVARQLPASVVYEDAEVLGFMDIGQVNPGHVLVALKEHAEDAFALDEAQAGAVYRAATRLARAIRDAFAPQGVSMYQANGAAAGQTVLHFHLHVLPRWENDGMALAWPAKNPPREKLEEYAARIRARLA